MQMTSMPPRMLLALLLYGSALLLGGAYAFQYIGGLEPCQLCLYQRIPHGLVIAITLVALALKPRGVVLLAILLALGLILDISALLAGFHVGVEQKWWEGLPGCTSTAISTNMSIDQLKDAILGREKVVPCDEVVWSLFGISMAGYNFIASMIMSPAAFLGAAMVARSMKREART